VIEMPATARDHDADARSGSVLLDDGTLVGYSATAFDAGGLRLLRPGQRVRVRRDPDGVIVALTLPTFELP
jgi:2-phospho-L-lactate guanylyltransferase